MGQVLHGSATTTKDVRRAIQNSQQSLRALSTRYGINQKTVAKWKKRAVTTDLKTGPSVAQSTVLSVEEEAVIVAFRRHTLLPLDDCLYAFQPTIAHLTRSSLHRCLVRHGIYEPIGLLAPIDSLQMPNACLTERLRRMRPDQGNQRPVRRSKRVKYPVPRFSSIQSARPELIYF